MASTSNPISVNDGVDDDEFDWDAAVREIDIACAKSKSTTDVIHQGENFNKKSSNYHSSTSSKQATLERFLGISSNSKDFLRKDTGKQKVEDFDYGVIRNCNNGEGQEGNAEEIPSFVKIDPEAAKKWIYPVSEKAPLREYQYNITQTALFCNTLVALPTGLGKTFIAAVVMYNYYRWYPEGKIVFAAPSRPLVMQQIEACHKFVGIPQEWTIDLTGQTSPTKRASFWKSKRVFFVTPQVLEKDIYSGACLVKHFVCLVIDEAHRATGNYSYCVVVRELMSASVPLRILALTATPGSKQQTIQHIIDNLQISTLEYRNESDPDVKPYVHDRKIELIKVPLGKDAVEIDKLMLDVILPYVNRLSQLRVLPNRDFQTLSPCDILISRDKFRQQPPADLPQSRYGELEGCFGVLVTLYHIRKLLSSHGIRPAFEMLDEKLRQGSFARMMCRNEGLMKAKLLMQQNMSHGAPSPKLSKMLEVLIDHFKTKDQLNSRVIIFSNFRGSVRDIMDALKNIEEYVKPTEFIGQSSGKTLKGQTQKVQQAVLEKFRAGGYNVIVATSIGEEGLDIMEVDLVICFDANISPLRMIQRMGRTGRKHEGRVVVLACEGSELRGYMRKQSTSKVMKKHMKNGGTTSFCFHSSPRMIPHVFKPEVQVVELSIQQFVPRGSKKVCEDQQLTDSPVYKTKLTDSENSLIAKYFNSTKEDTWKPSLIAFPHFQSFPSRVHRVVHSVRSTMLIEAMQLLQEISCSKDDNAFDTAGREIAEQHTIETVKENIERSKGELHPESPVSSMKKRNSFSKEDGKGEGLNAFEKPMGDIVTKGKDQIQTSASKSLTHSFLFDTGFVSVDDLGKVEISSVPQFPLINSFGLKRDPVEFGDLAQQNDLFVAQMESCGDGVVKSLPVEELVIDEMTSPMQVFMQESNKRCPDTDSPKLHEPCIDADDVEFSPRLSNYILSGVVPESPINYAGVPASGGFMVPDLPSTPKVHTELPEKSLQQNREAINETEACLKNAPSLSKNETQSPILHVEETRSPVERLPNTRFSGDLQLNDEGMPESVEPKYKLKRLRKHGDLVKKRPPDCENKKIGRSLNFTNSSSGGRRVQIQGKRVKQRWIEDAKVFIEEEAEVSSDVTVSEDEEDQHERNSSDSFIDDKIHPTASDTQAEVGRIDMMAVYRRSLLTQSPLQRMVDSSADVTPNSLSRTNETASTSGRESLQTPENILQSTSRDSNSVYIINSSNSRVASHAPEHDNSKTENRKRKASLYEAGHMPIQNLDNEFLVHSKIPRQGSVLQGVQVNAPTETVSMNAELSFLGSVLQVQVNGPTETATMNAAEPSIVENMDDVFFDEDEFFNEIDFDAMEEAATKLLRCKSECVVTNQTVNNEPEGSKIAVSCSPTFDLGI